MSLATKTLARFGLAVSVVLAFFSLYNSITGPGRSRSPFAYTDDSSLKIPRHIFQTWGLPAHRLKSPYSDWAGSWSRLNPRHHYKLITDEDGIAYVKDRYKDEPTIVDTFIRISDNILRADYLRYLVLYADGGVYTDMDTICVKPIDKWIPEEFKDKAEFVAGIEYDSMGAEVSDRTDFRTPVQFCQWTLMSAPGHSLLRAVIDIVTANLRRQGGDLPLIRAETQSEVLHLTGPFVFTTAMMKSLSDEAGHKVAFSDLSGMYEPKLYGSILVMPINSFSSGSIHSNASAVGNAQQLITHRFNGMNTWRLTHV